MIPFIGDWHVLKNFQSVLMKVYYDAGMKDLAEAAGFRGKTLTSLKKYTNFKRTHTFLLQCWEAFYQHLIESFLSSHFEEREKRQLLSSVKVKLDKCNETDSSDNLLSLMNDLIAETEYLPDEFIAFVTSMACKDSTWKFWKNFVFYDAFSYICLFLSARSGVWNLQLAGIKLMAPLFAAFDHTHYQKMLPQHLRELIVMPQEVINFFESGGFVCSVSGRYMQSVALDEAHEILVNKDLKTTVVRPSKEYLDRILCYYPTR